jgi:small neutral amino acid transporter SnatA (MarC family)
MNNLLFWVIFLYVGLYIIDMLNISTHKMRLNPS